LGQNLKTVLRKINDLRASTFLFSLIFDGAEQGAQSCLTFLRECATQQIALVP
jgi:hypothetical protein